MEYELKETPGLASVPEMPYWWITADFNPDVWCASFISNDPKWECIKAQLNDENDFTSKSANCALVLERASNLPDALDIAGQFFLSTGLKKYIQDFLRDEVSWCAFSNVWNGGEQLVHPNPPQRTKLDATYHLMKIKKSSWPN